MSDSPVHGFARLDGDVLYIKRTGLRSGKTLWTAYRYTVLDPDPSIGSPALRLTKAGTGKTYDLLRTEHGWQCECEDWHNRRDGRDREGCKHVRAARATGLIDARGDAAE